MKKTQQTYILPLLPSTQYLRDLPPQHALPPVNAHMPPTGGGGGGSAAENNGKAQSPHVIKIDLDSDSSSGAIMPQSNRGPSSAIKNITIGQITDSVIAKDFANNSMLSHRPPYGGMYHHEQQQQHQHQQHQQQPPVSMGAPMDHQWVRRLPPGMPLLQSGVMPKDPSKDMGRGPTPDDRQIIRLAQTPSPRAKNSSMPMHEPVSPPDDHSGPQPHHQPQQAPVGLPSHYYSSVGQTSISLQPLQQQQHGGPPQQDRRPNSGPPLSHGSGAVPTSSHQTNFVLDCYVKNRIVEEMRIQEKGGGDRQGQGQGQGGPGGPPHDRSGTPDERPNSRTSAPPPLGPPYGGSAASSNPPVSTTVAYPYSAWNVSGAQPGNHVGAQPPTSVGHKPVDHGMNSGNSNSGPSMGGDRMGGGGGGGGVVSGVGVSGGGVIGGGGGPPAEPKPLLSSQYEELSDEDEGTGN